MWSGKRDQCCPCFLVSLDSELAQPKVSGHAFLIFEFCHFASRGTLMSHVVKQKLTLFSLPIKTSTGTNPIVRERLSCLFPHNP